MHSLKGPNFPSFPTFKSLFPLHHLPLSVALIPTPLQTLSSYFVEDMIANAALKVEAAIVFLSNTPIGLPSVNVCSSKCLLALYKVSLCILPDFSFDHQPHLINR